jgi:hypothetical protein
MRLSQLRQNRPALLGHEPRTVEEVLIERGPLQELTLELTASSRGTSTSGPDRTVDRDTGDDALVQL